MTRVLVIAPASALWEETIEALSHNGCVIDHFSSPEPPLEQLASGQQHWSIALTDEINLLEAGVLRNVLPVILVRQEATIREAVRAMRAGAADYHAAPVNSDELMASIEQARLHSIQDESPNEPLESFPMVGECPAIRELRERISKVAPTDTPVLVRGEAGSGKELVARAVHSASSRRHQPLITVHCASIPNHLLEAELFGRANDAGANEKGLIDTAEGGTLFLDEVADLPSEVQARLLRLMQTGEVRPLGGTNAHPTDVRLVAATHKDLQQLVNEGHFREDLFYRMNVVQLEVPPLRSRGNDARLLAEWILNNTAARLNRPVRQFSSAAMDSILRYNWPGNVRELENAIERAVILAETDTITPELLAVDPSAPETPMMANDPQDQTSLENYFVRFVLDHEEQLTETQLAEKLGISRKSLWERRQRLNIPRKRTKKRGPRRAQENDTDSSQ